jgi:hypothetical protein
MACEPCRTWMRRSEKCSAARERSNRVQPLRWPRIRVSKNIRRKFSFHRLNRAHQGDCRRDAGSNHYCDGSLCQSSSSLPSVGGTDFNVGVRLPSSTRGRCPRFGACHRR